MENSDFIYKTSYLPKTSNQNYVVSIVVITYNHERYILECINSALIQKCNFKIEIIISNDCSSDSTDAILSDLVKKSQNQICIKYFKHNKNIGASANVIFALKQATGKYIALLEGDDYWIDSEKIQKQADFLDKNEDYSICFHNVNFISDDGKLIDGYEDKEKETFFVEDTYPGTFMATASMVWRSSNGFPKELFNKIPYGDWAIQMFSLYKGKGYCFKERMANYRFHPGGMHSNLSALIKLKNRTHCYREFYSYFKMTKEQSVSFCQFYSKAAWDYFFTALSQRKVSHIFISIKYLISIKNEDNFWKIILHLFRIKRLNFN